MGLVPEKDRVDLIVRNARLADRPLSEPLDIGVAASKIVAIATAVHQKPGARSARCGRSRP
jgi:hypothetical protein